MTEIANLAGPIAAAMIAGAVTFIATLLSKDQKTSEFRQTWIDAIRADIAEFLSLIVLMHDFMNVRDRNGQITDGVSYEVFARTSCHWHPFKTSSAIQFTQWFLKTDEGLR